MWYTCISMHIYAYMCVFSYVCTHMRVSVFESLCVQSSVVDVKSLPSSLSTLFIERRSVD